MWCVWCFGVFCCVVLVFCVFLNVSDTLLVDVLVSRWALVLGFGFCVFWGLFSFSLGTKAGVDKYRPDAMQTDSILDTPFGWPGTKAGVVKCCLDGVQTDGILDDLIGCFRSTL